MTREEAKSCIYTIGTLKRLAYNIHGVMDVIDADNCNKIIKSLEREPCEDCISREDVEKITWEEPSYSDAKNVLTEVRDKVRKLPSVTPQPKVGEWLKNGELCKCSNCHSNVLFTNVKIYKYCYHCGAKMEAEK